MKEFFMSGLTLMEAQAQLATWLVASTAVSHSQSYTLATESGSRSLTRADAAEIRQHIRFWDKQVRRLSRGGLRTQGVSIDYT
jgi:hypothetical protein